VVAPFYTTRPGTDQGRVSPVGFVAPGGSKVLGLGSILGLSGRFAVGDRIQVAQSDSTAAATKLIGFTGRLEGPSRMPAVSAEEPIGGFTLANGQTLVIRVDRNVANQTVTFATADFVDITNARMWEIRDAINDQITGAEAVLTGDSIAILSDRVGRGSRIQVVGGTANAALQFAEWAWFLHVKVGGTSLATREAYAGESFDLDDVRVPANGAVTIAFALELGTK
jgi:hypothetical protein